MKIYKIILLLTVVSLFTSVPFGVEAKDCSHIKKLHKKLMCKAGASEEKKVKGESFNEKYNSFADFFKKKK